jgi:DNA topoisomerase-1
MPTKKEIMERINKTGKYVDVIYICTDDDREGEAIAYHVYNELTNDNKKKTIRKTLKD